MTHDLAVTLREIADEVERLRVERDALRLTVSAIVDVTGRWREVDDDGTLADRAQARVGRMLDYIREVESESIPVFKRNEELRADLEHAHKSVDVARKEADTLRVDLARLHAECDGLRAGHSGTPSADALDGLGRDIHATLDAADVAPGSLRGRVDALLANLRFVRMERETVRSELERVRADLADHRTALAHASAKRDAFREEAERLRADLAALRAERAPPPEPAASERVAWVTYPGDSGPGLHIDGRERGNIVLCDDGTWLASAFGASQVLGLPDEPTARAVLLALAGEDPGVTVALSLRASWTREDVDRALDAGFGWCVAPLLEGYAEGWDGTRRVKDPNVIRQWVAGGQGLMTLRVVEESADGCPF